MSRDRMDLRSGLLLGVVALAAMVWLATLFGLGGQLGDASIDAASPPPLPVLPPLADDPMRDPASAAAVSERPVFSEDRRPHPFRLGGAGTAPAVNVKLTGVVIAGSFGMATLTNDQNRSLRLRLNGDAVDGWQLLALEPRRATVLGPDGAQVMELAVFDGQGGEPPTQLRPVDANGRRVPLTAAAPSAARPATAAPRAAGAADGSAAPAAAPAAAEPATHNGPSQEQMEAIRERIRARRQELQQQQQQRQSAPPAGGGAANN